MQLPFETNSLDDVPEFVREHYGKIKDGFRLELTGLEDVEEMRTAKDFARDGRNAAMARIVELERLAAEPPPELPPIPEPVRDPNDERLEKEYTDKLAAHVADREAYIASLRSDRNSTALERVAVEIASRLAIAGSHVLLLPHIRERLIASDVGGKFAVTARDAASIEHLVEQFRADPRFSRVLNGNSTVDKARRQRLVDETLGITATQAALTRVEFERLAPDKRAAYAREGGRIVDG